MTKSQATAIYEMSVQAPVADTTEAPSHVTTEDPVTDTAEADDETPGALTGQALLDLVRSCGENTPREELIRLAGYTKKVKDGSTRLMYANFMEALLEAQGTKIGIKTSTPQSTGARMGHPLSYLTRVHFNGNIMVGRAYVAMLPLHDKGTEFKVVVSPESNPGGINLVPVQ
jgi:hypothetical protein